MARDRSKKGKESQAKLETSIDREAKTPNDTGSFAVFYDESRRIAARFRQIASIKEQVSVALDINGPDGSKVARVYSDELESMAKRFGAWPFVHPETVALERPVLVGRLMDLQIICKVMALKTPGMPPEGF